MSQDLSPAEEFEIALRHWDDRFVAACRALLAIEVPEDIAYGLIWYQYDDSDALPLCHVWSDREHGTEVQYPSPLHVPIDEAWCEPEDMDDSEKGEILFRWIHRCWESAGGASSTVPFYGYNYHTGESYCLRRGRYVSQQEIEADIEGVTRS